MQAREIQREFGEVFKARRAWAEAKAQFEANVDRVLKRLMHEAAANYMSVAEVASYSGMTVKRVRVYMRKAGMDPRSSRNLLAKRSARALATNAELLGISPKDMDLTSPLAYLPMGDELRQEILDKTTAPVHELPDCEGWVCRSCGADNFVPDGFARVSGNTSADR